MVTVAMPLPRKRQSEPALPLPRWRVALIGALGVVLSVVGWVVAAQLGSAQQAAAGADAQRDALVRLVDDRCRAGQVADVAVCRAVQDSAPAQRR
jgi:hypothetical protein